MAIAISVGMSLLIGVTFMFQTQYFWGKEDNSNINTINSTITNITGSMGTSSFLGLIITVVLVLAIAMLLCTRAGF